MTARGGVRVFALAAAYAIGTITFGWWAVPAIGAAWGLIAGRGGARHTGIAVLIAWAALLAAPALLGAPIGRFAGQLAGAMAVPVWALLSAEIALPLTLACSATALFGSIRERPYEKI